MWNQFMTDAYSGMIAETISFKGFNDEFIRAYYSRPLSEGSHPGIVLIPHMPGWDEFNREVARRFTEHGYSVICPNIYDRFGHGLPADISAKAREAGGVSDESVMGDCSGALDYLISQPHSNGKVGVIGMCSGGRHTFLAACKIKGFSAAVDCWGGGVVAPKEKLTERQPTAPIDLTKDLSCPLLGIFGNDDFSPTKEQVDTHEAALKEHKKDYSFYRYDDAGHAFWSYHTDRYRPEQTMDSWEKVLAFFGRHLKGED